MLKTQNTNNSDMWLFCMTIEYRNADWQIEKRKTKKKRERKMFCSFRKGSMDVKNLITCLRPLLKMLSTINGKKCIYRLEGRYLWLTNQWKDFLNNWKYSKKIMIVLSAYTESRRS